MSDTRYWDKEFMLEFIDLYQSNPCLWKVRSKEYTNKNLKYLAYEKLIQLCKKINHDSNRDFLVKKIQSIRGSFRKELKKVEESKRSGRSTDEVYMSSLWYFNILFTKDQEISLSSISNFDEKDLEEEGNNDCLCSPENTGAKTCNEILFFPLKKKKRSETTKKRQYTNTREFLEMCKSALTPPEHEITEFDAVGISISKKLQRMEPRQAILAESIINTVLTRGLLSNLTETTGLFDENIEKEATDGQSVCSFYSNSYNFIKEM